MWNTSSIVPPVWFITRSLSPSLFSITTVGTSTSPILYSYDSGTDPSDTKNLFIHDDEYNGESSLLSLFSRLGLGVREALSAPLWSLMDPSGLQISLLARASASGRLSASYAAAPHRGGRGAGSKPPAPSKTGTSGEKKVLLTQKAHKPSRMDKMVMLARLIAAEPKDKGWVDKVSRALTVINGYLHDLSDLENALNGVRVATFVGRPRERLKAEEEFWRVYNSSSVQYRLFEMAKELFGEFNIERIRLNLSKLYGRVVSYKEVMRGLAERIPIQLHVAEEAFRTYTSILPVHGVDSKEFVEAVVMKFWPNYTPRSESAVSIKKEVGIRVLSEFLKRGGRLSEEMVYKFVAAYYNLPNDRRKVIRKVNALLSPQFLEVASHDGKGILGIWRLEVLKRILGRLGSYQDIATARAFVRGEEQRVRNASLKVREVLSSVIRRLNLADYGGLGSQEMRRRITGEVMRYIVDVDSSGRVRDRFGSIDAARVIIQGGFVRPTTFQKRLRPDIFSYAEKIGLPLYITLLHEVFYVYKISEEEEAEVLKQLVRVSLHSETPEWRVIRAYKDAAKRIIEAIRRS